MKITKEFFAKTYSDGEMYSNGRTHILVVWGYATGSEMGCHNSLNTEVGVYEWQGEAMPAIDLPSLKNDLENGWNIVYGFDVESTENEEIDWEDYENKLDSFFESIGYKLEETPES